MAKSKGIRQALEGDITGLSFKTTKAKPTSSFPVTSYRLPTALAEAVKQIAADLGITERTVKLHRTAISTKLQVRSVAALTRLAQAAGLFDGSPTPFPKG